MLPTTFLGKHLYIKHKLEGEYWGYSYCPALPLNVHLEYHSTKIKIQLPCPFSREDYV